VAQLYADEQFPKAVSELLRTYGHEVLTVQEAGNANIGIPDEAVLRFAVETQRAVLTLNRNDFAKLHRLSSQHFGILLCSNDSDRAAMAERTHLAIISAEPLYGKLIRVNRPA
jgi:predicted nuclease of predicted toxin-antitoxin system